jgi:hypothetical protein
MLGAAKIDSAITAKQAAIRCLSFVVLMIFSFEYRFPGCFGRRFDRDLEPESFAPRRNTQALTVFDTLRILPP